MCDKFLNSVPSTWISKRLKHITGSILAARTLALVDGYDTAFFTTNLIFDILQEKPVPIIALTDNQLLHKTVKTNKLTLDCCLRVGI